MSWILVFKLMLISLVTLVSCKSSIEVTHSENRSPFSAFGVSYAKITPEQVEGYSMVIIESDFYSKAEIAQMKSKGTKVLAYISLGEVDTNRWYYPKLMEGGFLGKNKNWGSSFLNLEDSLTRSILIDQVLPELTKKGVDGIFMDTIDSVSPYTSRSSLASYMVEMIREIRKRNPDLLLVQNAGLFLLEDTSEYIDGVLMEDIASGYNFEQGEYFVKDDISYHERLSLLRSYSTRFDLPFLVLDFAIEAAAINKVQSRLDTLGMPYFISNIELSTLPVYSSRAMLNPGMN
ncbi:MAG: hypothetical protein ED557_01375 [Balneola sp.]|nr:MAG: hypothetical protein ED557_01375 [Balneola sp.]